MPKKLISVLILLTFFPSVAMGLPAGGKVAGGVANINQPKGQTLSINQLTERTIINWKGFSIDVNELVRFIQPSSKSIVLNRVTGVDPSSILGRLAANGRVFIVNPNGILFGPNSRVDVAGLLATTLNINDNDFLAGKYNFSQDPNKALSYVINKGEIKIADNGFVFLVAPGVVNEGLMIANLGKAVMASGQKLAVDFMGDGLITFAIEGKVLDRVLGPDGTPLTSAVNNSGTIRADGGQVVLTAKASSEIFSSVVNNSGVIEARSLVNHGGVIRLEGSDPVANTGQIGWQNNLSKVQNAEGAVINTGKLDVSAAERGAAPGQITLSGQMVGSSGTILARGADGSQGGRVLITSTDKTVLTSDSQIDTSGVNNSSAGNVVVWSDKDTIYGGNILAKGGEVNGDGGWVEVSGHENLSFAGTVNTLAPNGATGTLLLDPRDITVAAAGAATLTQVDEFSDMPSTDLTIASGTINSATSNVILQANRDIMVNNAINMVNPGLGITMQAGRDISVNAGISTNNANISLTANDSTAISANRTNTTAGDITFGAGANLSAGTGDIALTIGPSTTNPFNPGSIINVRDLTTTGGNISINSPNNVSLSGAVNAGAGNVTINANTDGAGAQGFTMNAGSSITTTGGVNININATGGGTGTASLRDIATSGMLTVQTNTGGNTTGGAISQTAGTTITAGSANLSTGNGAITLNTATNDFGTVAVSRATNVTLQDANSLNLGASTISGTLNITAAGAITNSGNLNVTGATTLAAGAGNDITLDSAGNNFSTVAITSGRNVTLVDSDALNLGTSTVSGALSITTGGPLTDSGNVVVTGTTTLAAGAGNNITLDSAGNNFSTVAITSGNNVTLRDANALDLAASTISGNLNVTTAGAITDSGNLTVTGTTTLAAGAGNDITLDSAGNNFSTVAIASGRNVTLIDADALNLGTSTVSGTLNVTTGGPITDSGNLTITGATTLAAGAGNDITLNNANNFSTVSIASGRNVTLNDTSALILGASTVSGTLGVTTAGAITQSGALNVTGTATLAAGSGNDITLNNPSNDFSTVGITSGRNITLVDSNALDLGTSTVSSDLALTANGTVTQSGALSVAGTTSFTASAANTDILLDTQANNFGGVVSFAGTQSNLRDIALRNTNAGATVPTLAGLTSLRNLTLQYDNAAVNLPTLSATGALNVTAGGIITQSGNLNVVGPATLAAGANDVTLNNAGNDFSSVSITSGNNVTLADINALDLGSSTVSGALNVTTNGAITQSGPVAVAGATTLSAGTGDITLDNPLNDFSTVGVTSANNVTLRDSNNISLGTSAAGGNFSVTAGGAILDGDASAINITATTASLIAASTIGTAVDPLETNVGTLNASTTSGGIFINEANGITLGDISAGGGNIAISNASGNMTVNALTTTGGGVTLTSFGGAIQDGNGAANNVTAGTLTVSAANGIDLDTTLTALSSASVTGTGSIDISNAGALAVNNATSANGNIALNTTGGNLAINMVTAGGIGTVVLSTTTSGDVTLGTVATPNSVTITSAGRITDTNGVVNNITASTSTLTAAANIGTPGDPIETTVGALNGNATAGGIYINETDTVTLNNILAGGGNVTINNATGDMIIHSITATAGGIDLTTSAGSILDGNGAATNLTAVADSNLRALGGVIGLSTDPIEVNINPGLLGVAATGQIGGVSVHINGTVLPTNMLTLLNSPPGEVIFNSQSANPPPINLPNLISIAAELNSYRVNENDYFTDLLLDVLGDDFFKAQSFQCEMDDSLRQKLAADLCHNDDL